MIRTWLVPLLLAGALAACDSGAVNPGIVNTSTGGPVSQAPPNSPAIGATGPRARALVKRDLNRNLPIHDTQMFLSLGAPHLLGLREDARDNPHVVHHVLV